MPRMAEINNACCHDTQGYGTLCCGRPRCSRGPSGPRLCSTASRREWLAGGVCLQRVHGRLSSLAFGHKVRSGRGCAWV